MNRIKEYRERVKMSQVELARRAHIASPNLSAIECGRLVPWPKVKRALARVLNCSQDDLFPPRPTVISSIQLRKLLSGKTQGGNTEEKGKSDGN